MHGLMFGGFRVGQTYVRLASHDKTDEREKQFTDKPRFAGMQSIPDLYRAFGQHRVATHLRRKGWDVECLDYMYYFTEDELREYVDKRITKDTVFIGVSIIFQLDEDAMRTFISLMAYVRKKYPWVKFVAGGVKAYCITCLPNADYYIAGSGEYAMDALLGYLTNNNIAGGTQKPKMKKVAEGVEVIDGYDDYPCYPKRDAAISYEERDFIKPNEMLNIELGRGCRFACKYCSFPLLGLKGNMMRDEDSVHQELLENYERWGVYNYYITDDTVNDSKEKMKMVGNAVNRLPFQTQLHGYARGDLMIVHGKETWNDMIDAGFTSHSYGIESLNHESAKVMGKGMHPDKIKDGLLEIEEYFNKNSPYFYTGSLTMIAGLPFETFESLDATKTWLHKYWSNHTIAYLPLFLQPDDGGVIDDIDKNITNNFMDYGYTFEESPTVLNPMHRALLEQTIKTRETTNKHKTAKLNYWTHPSGDYDWFDCIDWCEDFNVEKYDTLGHNPTYCFQGQAVAMKEYHTPENFKHYYKADSWRHKLDEVNTMLDFLDNYKKEKMSYI